MIQQKIRPYPTLDQYIFSRTMDRSPDENITLISQNAVKTVQSLKNKPEKAIWLCGGADLAGQLLAEKLIDNIIVKLNPVVFGSGIPMFTGINHQISLKLTSCTPFKSGHILLYYEIMT